MSGVWNTAGGDAAGETGGDLQRPPIDDPAAPVPCAIIGPSLLHAAEKLRLDPIMPDPRDPDYSRPGIFATHNCWKCKDGKLPCVASVPGNCGYPHARND